MYGCEILTRLAIAPVEPAVDDHRASMDAVRLEAGRGVGALLPAAETVEIADSRLDAFHGPLVPAVLAGFQGDETAPAQVDLDLIGPGCPDPKPATIVLKVDRSKGRLPIR